MELEVGSVFGSPIILPFCRDPIGFLPGTSLEVRHERACRGPKSIPATHRKQPIPQTPFLPTREFVDVERPRSHQNKVGHT